MKKSFLRTVTDGFAKSLGYAPLKKGSDFKATAISNMKGFFQHDLQNGVMKRGVSFNVLRQIADRDPIIRICINTIKKAVSQGAWGIRVKDRAPKEKKYYRDKQYELIDRFENINDNKENFRILTDRTMEDICALDAGAIEVSWNLNHTRWVGLNSVDGATIRPKFDDKGVLDTEQAYVQFINDKKVASFKPDELIYIMANPQNSVEFFGYGKSPIESILMQVQASMEADMFNMKQFSRDNVPPGILDLGSMSDDEAENFIATWNATVIGNVSALKFVWGSDQEKKYFPFNTSNKDMQFIEYIDWLSRIKLAAFGLSTLDANIFQDVNRGTAEVQMQKTQSGGIKNAKNIYAEYLTRELIYPLGEDYKWLEFYYKEAEMINEKKTQAEIDAININSGIYTPDEVRYREGLMVSNTRATETETVQPQGTSTTATQLNDNVRQPAKQKISGLYNS